MRDCKCGEEAGHDGACQVPADPDDLLVERDRAIAERDALRHEREDWLAFLYLLEEADCDGSIRLTPELRGQLAKLLRFAQQKGENHAEHN